MSAGELRPPPTTPEGMPGSMPALKRVLADVLGEDHPRRAPELLLALNVLQWALVPRDQARDGCPYWGVGGRLRVHLTKEQRVVVWEALTLAADENRNESLIAQLELGRALAKRFAPARPRLSSLYTQALALWWGLTVDQVRAKESAAERADQLYHEQYRKLMRRQVPRDAKWPHVEELIYWARRALDSHGGQLAGLKRYAERERQITEIEQRLERAARPPRRKSA